MAFSESRVKMIFMMNWKDIWMTLFGTVDLLGLNEGFWVSMAVVALIVVVMNAVFGGIYHHPAHYDDAYAGIGAGFPSPDGQYAPDQYAVAADFAQHCGTDCVLFHEAIHGFQPAEGTD